MAGRIELTQLAGPRKGDVYEFEGRETALGGRGTDCRIPLTEDGLASRHHFLLEIAGHRALVRDLGSTNGTWVNDLQLKGRPEGAPVALGEVAESILRNGDVLKAGQSRLGVKVFVPLLCSLCGNQLPDTREIGEDSGPPLCVRCSAESSAGEETFRCQGCGRDVSIESSKLGGDYFCENCRGRVQKDAVSTLGLLSSLSTDLGVSPVIGGYRIVSRIGVGGFGAVFRAESDETGEIVAVKVLLSQVAVQDQPRQRFLQEIELMQELRHENLVPLISHGCEGGAFYFVMEYMAGGCLNDLMARRGGPVELAEARDLILGTVQGLAFAHDHGVVHRDIKPANILLDRSGTGHIAKITDLGLAKSFDNAGFSGLTVTGSTAGTPHYMPREQVIDFKSIRPASDVWSTGATFYRLLTGEYPRRIREEALPIAAILTSDVIPIGEQAPELPKDFAAVIDRCLEREVGDRYPDAGALLEALREVLP